ncbi:MAG: ATP-dependent zinc metalloprotease FtsH [Actinobacteria bacterium]|jgi:cell division protease FtsH|nr:ATP-dependent zinc metalloprotease FtsH [Actinomycetota bacterium]
MSRKGDLSKFIRSAFFPILVVIILVVIVQWIWNSGRGAEQSLAYQGSDRSFAALLKAGKVGKVEANINDQTMIVTLTDKTTVYKTSFPDAGELTKLLQEHPEVEFRPNKPGQSWWGSALTFLLPFVLIIAFWMFMMNQMQGGGSKVMSFGKSRARRVSPDSPKVTFKDVAGVDEAVEELQEIKEFLENPKKFQQLGARIPKGVLLYGPPGTGKTLLARAVAGEAGVPFFSISGSDFVEMFVGVGASRVRDLFEQAKQHAPCIVFVDEIDAVGRHRGAGLGGGHDEREQTLNQLLVEMDGFDVKDNIILIAATNRPDILDPALLRPGRFDRQIVVDRPDRAGRRRILEVHARGKPISKEIDIDALAAQTPGFTGADLANLVNEAALLAARHGRRVIGMEELEEGIMRVLAGPEKKSRLISEKEKAITAYHEMGHALVGHFLPNTDPVHKISIVSRGQALGFTLALPIEDKFLTTMAELKDNLAMTLGGRAAEEVVFGEITTGAANDLEKATTIAKQMIMRYGMSEELGPRTLGHNQTLPFLGREFSQEPDYSEEVARQIDAEIRRIIEEAHERAKTVLRSHREQLDGVTKVLISRETLERVEFESLLDGVSEEDIFREKDERQRQRAAQQGKPRGRRERIPPKVVAPAPVNPINPDTA